MSWETNSSPNYFEEYKPLRSNQLFLLPIVGTRYRFFQEPSLRESNQFPFKTFFRLFFAGLNKNLVSVLRAFFSSLVHSPFCFASRTSLSWPSIEATRFSTVHFVHLFSSTKSFSAVDRIFTVSCPLTECNSRSMNEVLDPWVAQDIFERVLIFF